VHAPSLLEEETHLLWDCFVLCQDGLKGACTRSVWVDALDHLGKLQRVAEQDESLGCRAARERIGEAELSGLINDHVSDLPIQLLASEEPRRTGDKRRLRVEHFREPAPGDRHHVGRQRVGVEAPAPAGVGRDRTEAREHLCGTAPRGSRSLARRYLYLS
jgi:hypothetical protein